MQAYGEKQCPSQINRKIKYKALILFLSLEGEGVGWMGSFGFTDADYCLRNGLAMRSCCAALGTMSGHVMEPDNMRKKNVYMYV